MFYLHHEIFIVLGFSILIVLYLFGGLFLPFSSTAQGQENVIPICTFSNCDENVLNIWTLSCALLRKWNKTIWWDTVH